MFLPFRDQPRDDTIMQEIITSFVYKYGLNRAEVMTEIEAVFSAMLSRWYHLPVMVFFRKDL